MFCETSMKILQGVGNTEVEKHKQLFLSVWNGTSELFLSVWNGTSEWYIIEKPVSTTQKRPYSANCWGVGDRINIAF